MKEESTKNTNAPIFLGLNLSHKLAKVSLKSCYSKCSPQTNTGNTEESDSHVVREG